MRRQDRRTRGGGGEGTNTESNNPSKRSTHNHDYLMLHKLEMSKFVKSSFGP